MRDELGKIDSIASTRTTIVLETVKETSALPLGSGQETAPRRRRGARDSAAGGL
jgi:hypothetical protein